MSAQSLPEVLVFAFVISFGAVISPGPVTAAILSEAPRGGWRVGPLVASGHAFLELLMVLLISVGFTTGMATPVVRIVIAIAGGFVLLWIGTSHIYSAWKSRVHLPQVEGQLTKRSPFSLIALGVITTISNPFWYTWWVTVAAGYLSQALSLGYSAIGTFYLGHILADFAWDTTLSTATNASRPWLTDTRYRLLIMLTGGFMVYLGVVFLRSAFAS
ncbi:MAG TPA: LysE family transporter [Anaerolineae bacterium]|nr:LysE family transporter [Anaerolineae bacterium]